MNEQNHVISSTKRTEHYWYQKWDPTPVDRNSIDNHDILSCHTHHVFGGERVVVEKNTKHYTFLTTLRTYDTMAMMKLWRWEVVSSASMAEWLRAWDTMAMMKLWRREVVSSASMAGWLRACDTLAMMKLWRREVVSSASMAEWLRVWDTLAMMKLWRREVVSSASMAEWFRAWTP